MMTVWPHEAAYTVTHSRELNMKPKVYIETFVSYLTSRPSRDVVIAGYQQTARDWWRDAADRF